MMSRLLVEDRDTQNIPIVVGVSEGHAQQWLTCYNYFPVNSKGASATRGGVLVIPDSSATGECANVEKGSVVKTPRIGGSVMMFAESRSALAPRLLPR